MCTVIIQQVIITVPHVRILRAAPAHRIPELAAFYLHAGDRSPRRAQTDRNRRRPTVTSPTCGGAAHTSATVVSGRLRAAGFPPPCRHARERAHHLLLFLLPSVSPALPKITANNYLPLPHPSRSLASCSVAQSPVHPPAPVAPVFVLLQQRDGGCEEPEGGGGRRDDARGRGHRGEPARQLP